MIRSVADEFALDTNSIYLNAASAGPLPLRSRNALDRFYDLTVSSPWKTDAVIEGIAVSCRELAAGFIKADPSDVTYAYTTSYGLNIAAQGLPLESGDDVILSAIDFPANPYTWLTLQERGVKVHFADAENRRFSFENVERLVNQRTKVIAVSFVQFFNGDKLPIKRLAELAHSVDAFLVVDAIQGLGPEPIDFSGWNIDLLSAGGQKWLLAPLGIGLMAVSKRVRDAMKPVARSWMSVEWSNYVDLLQYDRKLFADSRRFSAGSPPAAHLIALNESLTLLTELGATEIQSHVHSLLDILISYLESHDKYKILSPLEPERRSAILSFTCPNYKELFEELTKAGVVCVMREGGIRISPYVYNTPSEIERFIEILDSSTVS